MLNLIQRRTGLKMILLLSLLIGAVTGCRSLGPMFPPGTEGTRIPVTHPSISYLGRFDESRPGVIRFGYSSSQVTLHFFGRIIKAKIKDEARFPLFPNRLLVIIDNTLYYDLTLSKRDEIYTLAEFLTEGEHTITLFKQTEAYLGWTDFEGFILDEKGLPLDPLPPKERRIEFIGDSITCGFGVHGEDANEIFKASTESSFFSYAGISSRILNADAVTICQSGIGVIRNFSKKKKGTMPKLYPYITTNTRTIWVNKSWDPLCIVINLGTNDFSNNPLPNPAEFVSTYVKFIESIRKRYPDRPIILVMGPMFEEVDDLVTKDLYGHLLRPFPLYRLCMDAVIREAHNRGLEKITLFELSNEMSSVGYGSNYHPGRLQQEISGKELAFYLSGLMDWPIQP